MNWSRSDMVGTSIPGMDRTGRLSYQAFQIVGHLHAYTKLSRLLWRHVREHSR